MMAKAMLFALIVTTPSSVAKHYTLFKNARQMKHCSIEVCIRVDVGARRITLHKCCNVIPG